MTTIVNPSVFNRIHQARLRWLEARLALAPKSEQGHISAMIEREKLIQEHGPELADRIKMLIGVVGGPETLRRILL